MQCKIIFSLIITKHSRKQLNIYATSLYWCLIILCFTLLKIKPNQANLIGKHNKQKIKKKKSIKQKSAIHLTLNKPKNSEWIYVANANLVNHFTT